MVRPRLFQNEEPKVYTIKVSNELFEALRRENASRVRNLLELAFLDQYDFTVSKRKKRISHVDR